MPSRTRSKRLRSISPGSTVASTVTVRRRVGRGRSAAPSSVYTETPRPAAPTPPGLNILTSLSVSQFWPSDRRFVVVDDVWAEEELAWLRSEIQTIGGVIQTDPIRVTMMDYLVIPSPSEERIPNSGLGPRLSLGITHPELSNLQRVSRRWIKLCVFRGQVLDPDGPVGDMSGVQPRAGPSGDPSLLSTTATARHAKSPLDFAQRELAHDVLEAMDRFDWSQRGARTKFYAHFDVEQPRQNQSLPMHISNFIGRNLALFEHACPAFAATAVPGRRGAGLHTRRRRKMDEGTSPIAEINEATPPPSHDAGPPTPRSLASSRHTADPSTARLEDSEASVSTSDFQSSFDDDGGFAGSDSDYDHDSAFSTSDSTRLIRLEDMVSQSPEKLPPAAGSPILTAASDRSESPGPIPAPLSHETSPNPSEVIQHALGTSLNTSQIASYDLRLWCSSVEAWAKAPANAGRSAFPSLSSCQALCSSLGRLPPDETSGEEISFVAPRSVDLVSDLWVLMRSILQHKLFQFDHRTDHRTARSGIQSSNSDKSSSSRAIRILDQEPLSVYRIATQDDQYSNVPFSQVTLKCQAWRAITVSALDIPRLLAFEVNSIWYGIVIDPCDRVITCFDPCSQTVDSGEDISQLVMDFWDDALFEAGAEPSSSAFTTSVQLLSQPFQPEVSSAATLAWLIHVISRWDESISIPAPLEYEREDRLRYLRSLIQSSLWDIAANAIPGQVDTYL
ncbi:hypothetical protein BD324DRAFT_684322 [Kockovaella imperatae]|uniref:Uncharacterized protein n=1 Tax=Kockovaella imperatae TaxID=4999 RepID=A0A1Y1U5P6_9TREE|nr:hypothetical protein BD324DRAFT_684322 [Kockovaella imperatae]ORX33350.1 hypothetical protein BD324DRAFT_684322 [Kockovaella imperatae]